MWNILLMPGFAGHFFADTECKKSVWQFAGY
jgi:hypothetical protein